jgi:C4-dicarboxylate-specific signal transduction histidine kinase
VACVRQVLGVDAAERHSMIRRQLRQLVRSSRRTEAAHPLFQASVEALTLLMCRADANAPDMELSPARRAISVIAEPHRSTVPLAANDALYKMSPRSLR